MYSGPLSKALSLSRSSSCGQCLGYEGITSHVTGTAQHPVKRWLLLFLRAGGPPWRLRAIAAIALTFWIILIICIVVIHNQNTT